MREKGTLSFSANFEAQKSGPLDARMITDTLASLTEASTWQANDGSIYVYTGMIVSVYGDATSENNGLYRLTTLPFNNINNWEKLGSDSGGTLYHNNLLNRDAPGNHSNFTPISDSTTAFQFTKADEVTTILNIDTLNGRVGINTIPLTPFHMRYDVGITNVARVLLENNEFDGDIGLTLKHAGTDLMNIYANADGVESYVESAGVFFITGGGANDACVVNKGDGLLVNNGNLRVVNQAILPVIRPLTDSTTAIQITKADGITSILNIDSINNKISANVSYIPTEDVNLATKKYVDNLGIPNITKIRATSVMVLAYLEEVVIAGKYFLDSTNNLYIKGVNARTDIYRLLSCKVRLINTANGKEILYDDINAGQTYGFVDIWTDNSDDYYYFPSITFTARNPGDMQLNDVIECYYYIEYVEI